MKLVLLPRSANHIFVPSVMQTYLAVLKLGQFAIPKTCENWLGLVNSYIYYACQTCEMYQVLPYSLDFKAPRELLNPLS